MVGMGYNLEEIQDSLAKMKYDEITATYLLLGRKASEVHIPACSCHSRGWGRGGGSSLVDFSIDGENNTLFHGVKSLKGPNDEKRFQLLSVPFCIIYTAANTQRTRSVTAFHSWADFTLCQCTDPLQTVS